MGVPENSFDLPPNGVIILAEDLTPADTVQFPRERILGICTQKGGPTSHTAILSRSLGVPAAVSVPFDLPAVQNGVMAILNGDLGSLGLAPSEQELRRAFSRQANLQNEGQRLIALANQPALTRDGRRWKWSPISARCRSQQALRYGAEGVGLLRTEFLYLDREIDARRRRTNRLYQEILKIMGTRPVVVRTLDIGGDKALPYLDFVRRITPSSAGAPFASRSDLPDLLKFNCAPCCGASPGTTCALCSRWYPTPTKL